MAEAVVSLGRTQGAPQVSEVVETLLARFGGLPKFCELYHEQIDLAAKTKPGSKSVLDALYAVVKMVQAANQQVSPLDMSMLTDDDLARIVEEKLAPHSVVTEVTL
jgi:molybdopterin-guanine dinucleotide biosynthesis protein A